MRRSYRILAAFAAFAHALTFTPAAWANPVFSHAESGNVSVESDGSVYNIYASDRAIGAFHSFGNLSGETIHSIQASADHTALYRVIGGDPSLFFGQLNANSRIFLINQNGIVFGEGSSVNAAGLIASTLDIANGDFLSGNYRFERDPMKEAGYVLNQGDLVATNGGYIALLGGAVRNECSIDAAGGVVVLGAGDAMLVSLDGQGLVSVEIDGALEASVYDLVGNRLNEAIANSGTISAAGGKVLLSAEAAGEAFDRVINHSGTIEAQTVDDLFGGITVEGGSQGIVEITGSLTATGDEAGEKGGSIRVTGEKIGVFENARLDASGEAGGGEILVGGGFQGGGELTHASVTVIGSGAALTADARGTGDGGTVIVWSDEATKFYGTASTRGGAFGGNGGLIETSSKEFLTVSGALVDASAVYGEFGTWLLDPRNVTIVAPTAGGAFNGGTPNIFTPTADGATVDSATIETSLNAGTSVTITTGATGAQDGDITVTDDIQKTAGGNATLILNAADDIIINNAISSTTSQLAVTLTAGDGVDINSTITTNGGAFTSTGVAFDNTGGAVTTTGGNATLTHTGAVTVGAQISTTTGTVSVSAGAAVSLANSAITTTSGNVSVTSSAGAINATADDGSAEITSNGDVTLSGTAIGNATQLELTGNSNTRTLSLTTTDGAINVEELTNTHFTTVNLTLNDAGAATTVAVALQGADDVTFTDDGTTLAVGASGVLTNTGGRSVALTTTGLNVTFANASVSTGTGNFTTTATGGTINAAAAGNDTAEINSNGNVTLSGTAIGATNQLELTGATGTSTLALTTTDGAINVEELTNTHFTTVNLTLNDAGAATNVAVALQGADEITMADDGTTLTIGAAGVTTSTGNRSVTITTTGLNTTIGTGGIVTGTGNLSLTSTGGNISASNASDNAAEITSSGNVTFSGMAIGSAANELELSGDASADSTLTVNSTATAGEDVVLDVLTDQFSSISLTLTDADSDIDINLPGVDVIDINGAAATSTINNVVLTNTDPSFTYSLSEAQAVSINNIDAAANGIAITAQNGNLTVVAAGGGISGTGASAITLVADGGGTLTVNDAITTTGGAVTLRADDDVVFGASGDVSSNNGNITVKADFDDQANGTGGALMMVAGTLLNAGTGTLDLDADENITLGGLTTTNATNTAVTITSTSGAVVDGGDAATNVTVASGRLVVDAVTGIGSADAIEIDASSVDASVTGAGGIGLAETNAVTLTDLDTTNGSISVSAGGLITATDVNASGVGADVTLTTTAGGLSLSSVLADDDITATAAAGNIAVGTVGDAGTDDIAITATTGSITDANGGTLNIRGDALTLTAQGDIGSAGDPLELSVNSFTYNITGSGTAYLTSTGSSTLNISTSSGNINYATSGDLTVALASAAGGSVELTAGGSIFAQSDDAVVIARDNIRLISGGSIGTITRPLRFEAGGIVTIQTLGQTNNVSANLLGNVSRGAIDPLNTPQGLLLYNHSILGGLAARTDVLPAAVTYDPYSTAYSDSGYAANEAFLAGFPGGFSDNIYDRPFSAGWVDESAMHFSVSPELLAL